MNRTELYAKFAEKVVEDMDINDLMAAVAISIEERLEDLPEAEAIKEITESSYSELLDDYDAKEL